MTTTTVISIKIVAQHCAHLTDVPLRAIMKAAIKKNHRAPIVHSKINPDPPRIIPFDVIVTEKGQIDIISSQRISRKLSLHVNKESNLKTTEKVRLFSTVTSFIICQYLAPRQLTKVGDSADSHQSILFKG